MSQSSTTENERNIIASTQSTNPSKDTTPINVAEMASTLLSPSSTKARSLPSTPSQRPRSPVSNIRSPNGIPHRTIRDKSPQSLRASASNTPPNFRRGMICKYETGMKQARRRVPYTMGPELLQPDSVAANKKLSAKEEFRITADMKALYAELLPTPESEERRHRLITKLETLLQQRWPGQNIKVSVFGSTGNKLGTKESDVDICITTDCKEVEYVCSIADLLARNGMERVVCVSSAKVPIVKVWDPDLQVSCDMNVNNPIALENTELIRSYVDVDDRFRPLAMIVKHWARRRILNDAALGGTLSSYTWICLVLNFLQTRKPPVLPSLQVDANIKPHLIGGVNVAFDKDLTKFKNYGKANTSTLGELLFQFFHYYGHELDLEKQVISVRLGRTIAKTQKSWHLLQDNRLCVEEPFNISRNLGNTADDTSVRGIHLEIRRACNLIADGKFTECCEEYVAPQIEPQPRHINTFIPPTTKAIIPQPPPQIQPQPIPVRPMKGKHKNNPRNDRLNNGLRRASNPAGRHAHLQNLPFQMTPHELQIQAQHQQHLLHDQLFQQYQYLQLQEQELRLQLMRHRGLVAASSIATDDGQDSTVSSRTTGSSRGPMTAPLYPSRFGPSMMSSAVSSSGIVTNPGSPALNAAIPDTHRAARRETLSTTAANLRAHSQPARAIPASGMPFLTQRFDVPVRQVAGNDTRRSSINSTPSDPFGPYLNSRLTQHNNRYEAGRRPVEYVGYFVGQSPSVSAYGGSTTNSPAILHAGLAIHNGGLSPRMSARTSKFPSVTTSPLTHYASLVNTSAMASVRENEAAGLDQALQAPSSVKSGPLIVDGSINSPPRRVTNRPERSSSDELDNSVTTSEDAALDTPSSSDDFHHTISSDKTNGSISSHDADILQEREYGSLNGASNHFANQLGLDGDEQSEMMRKLAEESNLRRLTTALAAATVNNGPSRKLDALNMLNGYSQSPLGMMSNGHAQTNGPNEWQTQTKKKNNKKKNKQTKAEHSDIGFTGQQNNEIDVNVLAKGG